MFLKVTLKISDTRIAGAKFSEINGKFFHQQVYLIAGLGQGASAHPRGHIPFPLPHLPSATTIVRKSLGPNKAPITASSRLPNQIRFIGHESSEDVHHQPSFGGA
jgi:hypothetical protein